nr:TPA_asm: m102.2 sORF 2 [Murid betaherpesvirus 1]DBA08044.1 TPA_asm: m102.2 sORF 2 [Murid betaherpesvirus 1]
MCGVIPAGALGFIVPGAAEMRRPVSSVARHPKRRRYPVVSARLGRSL